MPDDSNRIDLSQHLIHFTKSNGEEDAFAVLLRILREGKLRGGAGFVRGGIPCVSFTEAPFDILTAGFNGLNGCSRYSSLGLRFTKSYIFHAGGRPVIYQPEADFAHMPPAMRWRHVRFEPLNDPPIDWMWEREWRLPCAEFPFTEKDVEIVLPNAETERKFVSAIEHESFHHAWELTQVLGDVAWLYHSPSQWRILRPKPTTARV